MTKYADLDAEILKRVALKPAAFKDLEKDVELWRLATAAAGFQGGYRALDRRLQALRKAGKIRFEGGYWKAVRS